MERYSEELANEVTDCHTLVVFPYQDFYSGVIVTEGNKNSSAEPIVASLYSEYAKYTTIYRCTGGFEEVIERLHNYYFNYVCLDEPEMNLSKLQEVDKNWVMFNNLKIRKSRAIVLTYETFKHVLAVNHPSLGKPKLLSGQQYKANRHADKIKQAATQGKYIFLGKDTYLIYW